MSIDDSTLPEGNSQDDSQPTPPPRKKKLKKKLEQLVEQNLNKVDVKRGQSELTPPNEETTKDTNEPLENDKSTSDALEADSDLGKEQLENKKSRRRRKHVQ